VSRPHFVKVRACFLHRVKECAGAFFLGRAKCELIEYGTAEAVAKALEGAPADGCRHSGIIDPLATSEGCPRVLIERGGCFNDLLMFLRFDPDPAQRGRERSVGARWCGGGRNSSGRNGSTDWSGRVRDGSFESARPLSSISSRAALRWSTLELEASSTGVGETALFTRSGVSAAGDGAMGATVLPTWSSAESCCSRHKVRAIAVAGDCDADRGSIACAAVAVESCRRRICGGGTRDHTGPTATADDGLGREYCYALLQGPRARVAPDR
jgi:hypothetical protein